VRTSNLTDIHLHVLPKLETLYSPFPFEAGDHHHQLQGLGLLTCSDLWVSQINPSVSSVVDFSLFFLWGSSYK
jgi:hypothetical protein